MKHGCKTFFYADVFQKLVFRCCMVGFSTYHIATIDLLFQLLSYSLKILAGFDAKLLC